MTEPVSATAPVRRTVRVATALVAGQALLCAVIGWVTFSPSETAPHAVRTVEPLVPPPAVPSAVAPAPPAPPSPPPVAPSARTARAKSSASRSPAAPRRPRPTTTQPAPPVDDEPPPTLVIAPPEPTGTRSPDPGLVGTGTPSPAETVQGPVTVGRKCAPEGARGLTADDRRVRCVRNDDGDLRWQII